ncbi:cysteine desulfurase family protein [Acetivibrio saccincola]|uniref:Cysteine desulfurase n=1 Tax=Acetivibrio saccincola TaxID=1677857 RepID=A0A2K9E0X7_9FIRM|nr:cysteine desulfurase family protein [Acetivibrio saccincola]AUG57432.1 Cysteine desulfurase [Acetivibrio saccincola]NLW27501.1 cysteine desulfurase [Acetivibrio saccincola]HQD29751.1 cysteine desulfurase family protein [Acetivibrio saccincola]
MRREIYLDNSATTKPYDEVVEVISDINRNIYGNPSSLHTKGIEAEKIIKNSREIIAKTLMAENDEIYFTSGGTEGNNLAILGYLRANPRKGKHVITTKIEHPSVLEVFKFLSTEGYRVDFIDVDQNGQVDVKDIEEKVCEETSLISIIYVNNEIGTIQPIEKIAKIKKDAVLHVDAVQGYGKFKIIPKKLGIDLMTISSHKIHGPKGVGAIYKNKNVRLSPILLGGGQESLIRSGTENVSGIYGFATAARITFDNIEENYNKCKKLKNLLVEKLKSEIEGVKIISPGDSLPYILNASFENIRGEVLLHHLEERNIFVSTGAACSSRKNIHSHVLKALGLPPGCIEGAIRFSFSHTNTVEDVEETVDALKSILPRISIRSGGRGWKR